MMRRVDSVALIGVIIVAVLLIGEIVVYVESPYSHGSELVENEDGSYSLSIDSNYSTEYTALAFETDANALDRHLFIYRDMSYPSMLDYEAIDVWIERMEAEFAVAGFDDYSIVDANGLQYVMEASSESGKATCTSVLIFTGVLPDTVYGRDASVLEDWLAAGGFLYWTGGIFARYVGHSDGSVDYTEVDPGSRFLGVPWSINDRNDTIVGTSPSEDREIGEAMNIFYAQCNYGVSNDVENAMFLGLVSDDGYNSISLCKYVGGTGQIAIFGGAFPPDVKDTAYSNIVKVITSRLCYDSEITLLQPDVKGPGEIEIPIMVDPSRCTVVYVLIGGMIGTYSATWSIPADESRPVLSTHSLTYMTAVRKE